MAQSRSTLFSFFALWALLACLLASAYPDKRPQQIDLSRKHNSQSPLGVQLDYDLAKYSVGKLRRDVPQVVFSSYLNFTKPVDTVTDGQLVQILRDAWLEFEANAALYKVDDASYPNALTIMAFDHEVMLSTSIRGNFYPPNYRPTPVSEMLQQCARSYQTENPTVTGTEKDQHRNDGKCGEVTAAQQFFLSRQPRITNNAKAIELFKSKEAREVTLVWNAKYQRPQLQNACGGGKEPGWGCKQFVKNFKIKYLGTKTAPKPYNLATLAGGLQPGYPRQQTLYYDPSRSLYPLQASDAQTTFRTSTHKTSMHKTSMHKTSTHKASIHKTSIHKTTSAPKKTFAPKNVVTSKKTSAHQNTVPKKTSTHKTSVPKRTSTHKAMSKKTSTHKTMPKKTSTRKNSTPKKTSTPKKGKN